MRAWAPWLLLGCLGYAGLAGGLLWGASTSLFDIPGLRPALDILFGAVLIALLSASDIGRWLWRRSPAPGRINPYDVLLICWLGLLPLFWFAGNHAIITGSDLWFPLKPADFLARSIFTWDDRVYAGYANFLRLPHIFPYYLLIGGLDKLGLPLPAVEGIWFVILFTAPGLAMYGCARAISRAWPVALVPLFAALIYMLNPLTLKDWAAGHELFALARAGWAGILGLLIYLHAGRLSPFRFALGLGLISLFMTPVMSNPALALVFAGSVAVVALGLAVRGPTGIKFKQAYGLAVLLTFLLHVWWILPSAILYRSSALSDKLSAETMDVVGEAEANSKYSSLSNLLRLTGYSGFWEGVDNEPYILFAPAYLHWLDLLAPLAFVVPALALVALYRARRDRLALILASQLVLSLLLAHSVHGPASFWSTWLTVHMPGAALFRDAYSKFVPIACGCYALLAPIGLGFLTTAPAASAAAPSGRWSAGLARIRPALNWIVLPLGLGWLVLVAWPLFTGDVIRRGGQVLADQRVTIPAEFEQAFAALQARGLQGRLLLAPASGVYVQYTWGYQGPEITTLLWPQPQLFANDGESPAASSRMMHLASELLSRGDAPDDLRQVLSLLNVQYVVERDDLDSALYNTDSPAHMDAVLEQNSLLSPVAVIGGLRLYAVQSVTAWPLVYTASDTPAALPPAGPLATALSAGETAGCPALLPQENGAEAAVRAVTQENPTRLGVDIASDRAYWLVFQESFDPNWAAYASPPLAGAAGQQQPWYRGSALLNWLFERNQRTEIAQHCLVNGYANAWYVPANSASMITLEFAPQRYFELGLLVAAVTLLASLGYFVVSGYAGCRRAAHKPA